MFFPIIRCIVFLVNEIQLESENVVGMVIWMSKWSFKLQCTNVHCVQVVKCNLENKLTFLPYKMSVDVVITIHDGRLWFLSLIHAPFDPKIWMLLHWERAFPREKHFNCRYLNGFHNCDEHPTSRNTSTHKRVTQSSIRPQQVHRAFFRITYWCSDSSLFPITQLYRTHTNTNTQKSIEHFTVSASESISMKDTWNDVCACSSSDIVSHLRCKSFAIPPIPQTMSLPYQNHRL